MRVMTVLLALMAGASCPSSISAAAPAAPEQLRCEGLANPLGIDRAQPRFSWAIPPGVRGLAQTARQVLVADSPDALAADRGTLWDSGKVESNQSQWVPYAGTPLAKGSRCWWKVRVWDQTGAPSPWSEPASFSVGPLSAADWSGEWIGADWMKNNEGPLPWLRKTVTLEKVPTTATAYVCALGYYELYVNGQKVGDDVLSPAVSDYGKRGLYLTHDITKYLVKGKNCIGLWLGRGWSLGVLKNAGIVGPMVKAEAEPHVRRGRPADHRHRRNLEGAAQPHHSAGQGHQRQLRRRTGRGGEGDRQLERGGLRRLGLAGRRGPPSSHAGHRRADDGAEPHARRGPSGGGASRSTTGFCSTWAATTPAGSSWPCPTT